MATTINLGPVTRVEGHLEVEVTVGTVGGVQQVTAAKSTGAMFRGFEIILQGRDPRDAVQYTQRICGVCPISHGMAAALTLEAAFGVVAPDNGRIMRNLVLGANYVQSHILHFYHLAALDFIDTTTVAATNIPPWTPRYSPTDMVKGALAATLVGHYVQALAIRRKAHQMGAIMGARLPCTSTFVAGGSTEVPDATKIANFRTLLDELRQFIDTVYVPDVLAVAGLFPEYYQIGKGPGNLMAYGVFDLDGAGATKLLKRGRYTQGAFGTVDTNQIKEYVKYSWYSSASGLTPAAGVTTQSASKANAYSWVKAPRYLNLPHEVGPLARMWINGDYQNGISALDRHAARALECQKVADAMDGWLNELRVGQPTFTARTVPATATGMGLTEAARGALGHWIQITKGVISRYQIITPTAWNASPMDDNNVMGPIEQALVGTPVKDTTQPIEVLRVIHSFDPCLSCAVHMVRPGRNGQSVVIHAAPCAV
jgi:hydrogenase large subunit